MEDGQTVQKNIAIAKPQALSWKHMTGQNSNFWLLLTELNRAIFEDDCMIQRSGKSEQKVPSRDKIFNKILTKKM